MKKLKEYQVPCKLSEEEFFLVTVTNLIKPAILFNPLIANTTSTLKQFVGNSLNNLPGFEYVL